VTRGAFYIIVQSDFCVGIDLMIRSTPFENLIWSKFSSLTNPVILSKLKTIFMHSGNTSKSIFLVEIDRMAVWIKIFEKLSTVEKLNT
jgi:hypothetical protein